jgi:hypothetical protein
MRVPKPPRTIAGTVPSHAAVSPDSNCPIWFEAPRKRLISLRFSSSGIDKNIVTICGRDKNKLWFDLVGVALSFHKGMNPGFILSQGPGLKRD